MSAFMLPAVHLAELAKAIRELCQPRIEPSLIAGILAMENVTSVCYRYKDDKPDQYQPEVDAAVMLADEPRQVTDPVWLLSMANSYAYQSCEHPFWENSRAYIMVEALKMALEPLFPPEREPSYQGQPPKEWWPKGYSEAPWVYEPGKPSQDA